MFSGLLAASALLPATAALAANIPECRRSRAASLVPAQQVEGAAQQQYVQMLREAQGQNALAPTNDAQLQRLRYIAARIVPFTPA